MSTAPVMVLQDLASNLRDKHPGNLPLRALYTVSCEDGQAPISHG